MKVLVFPAGSEIGLEIHSALKYSKDVEVYGATSTSDHSEVVYKRLFSGLPTIEEDSFIESLNAIIDEASIDFVYPALDSVQLVLAESAEHVHATIVSSPLRTVEICRSKRLTYESLKGLWFVPRVYYALEDVERYPVFVKPNQGQGSQGAETVYRDSRLEERLKGEDVVVCEFLPGDEYTVECLTCEKDLVYIAARKRERTKAGIAVRSSPIMLTDELRDIAATLNAAFCFRGAWFFQVKKDRHGKCRLLEVSPRIPGTSVVSRVQGVNLPLLTLYSFLGYRYDISRQRIPLTVERAFINRFVLDIDYDTVYIDLDDTIITDDRVNVDAISFLYQLKNEGKAAMLLTRHRGDVLSYLAEYCIDEHLFSKIVHLDENDEKTDYIEGDNAIFVDDSFSERMRVLQRKGIPVFDVDSLEALFDWKM